MSSIELTGDVCIDLLKRYIDTGYKNVGGISIKEGATLHKYFRVLKKQEEDASIKTEEVYKILFKVLDVFNSKGGYTLDDAAVIDRVINFVQENVLKHEPQEKIKEV